MRTALAVALPSVSRPSAGNSPNPSGAFVDHYQDRPAPLPLAERIEQIEYPLNATKLAQLLGVSRITVFKQAKAGRIPCYHVGTRVCFDPVLVARWLRTQ